MCFCSVLQLAYCIVQFLEKDPTLTEPVSAARTLHCPNERPNLAGVFFFVVVLFSFVELMRRSVFPPMQVIRGLLKFWPKTCSQKEVGL